MRRVVSWMSTVAIVALLPLGIAFAFNEAPDLAAKVGSGELPPVEERLPNNPLVIEPVEAIGTYGGTLRVMDNNDEFNQMKMMMYGFSLVRYANDGQEILPGLAERWTFNEDKSVWTLHLREGIRWSDGAPFTVDDILFWWNDMVLHEGFAEAVPDWGQAEGQVVKLEKLDDYTIRFTYAAPAPILDARLATWPNGSTLGPRVLVPAHYMKQFHPDYSDAPNFEVFEEMLDWYANPDYPVLTAWMPVEYRAGQLLILERNPYYYAVDTEGNQLPYIDRVEWRYSSDFEVIKNEIITGNIDFHLRPYLDLRDLALLRQNEERGAYRILMWDSGSGSGPLVYPNQNHPDPEKGEVYRNKNFRQALSLAINRDRINRQVYFGLAELTTGTLSKKAIEYSRTERGQNVYEAWRDSYVTYDPERAKALLDAIGVVDKNGDGWRDLPSGAPLLLRIDQDALADQAYVDSNEFIKENWDAIGLRTVINPVDGSQITSMQRTATYDIRDSWEVGDGPDHVVFPNWLIPISWERWAPLYGNWYAVRGTSMEGTELDKAARDRSPPREEPPAGSAYARLQEIYDKIKIEPDTIKRDNLVLDAVQIHIDEGPFMIGTAGNYPRLVVVKHNLRNVPDAEQLALGGFVNPWIVPYPAITNTEAYYFSD